MLANSDSFDIQVHGQGGHGAVPEGTVDAVLVASAVVMALHHLVSRYTSPFDPVALTVGTLTGGTARNIIADAAHMTGTLRTLTSATQSLMASRIESTAQSIAQGYGATVDFVFKQGYPVLRNDAAVVAELTTVLQTPGLLEVRSDGNIKLAGDDFAFFLAEAPGAYGFLGCQPPGAPTADHHSPAFCIDEDALPLGTMALIESVRRWAHPEP